MPKISIRFFNDREVRAVWNENDSKWYFSVLDIIGVLRGEDHYEKCRNYWKYLKSKLRKENSQLVSATTQLKITAADGKNIVQTHWTRMGCYCLPRNFPERSVLNSSPGWSSCRP